MFPSRREPLTPPPGIPPALRAAINAAVAVADPPLELHFLHRRSDGAGGFRRLSLLERCPQPGEGLAVAGETVGTVAEVCTYWTGVPAGGRVKVLVFEVG